MGTGDILLMVALHAMDYHLVKEGEGRRNTSRLTITGISTGRLGLWLVCDVYLFTLGYRDTSHEVILVVYVECGMRNT